MLEDLALLLLRWFDFQDRLSVKTFCDGYLCYNCLSFSEQCFLLVQYSVSSMASLTSQVPTAYSFAGMCHAWSYSMLTVFT